jgi:hypothetical protein
MTQLSIDIETLDTAPTSIILSVGMVAFEIGKYGGYEQVGYYVLNLSEQSSRTKSESTLKWWEEQTDRDVFTIPENEKTSLRTFSIYFNEFLIKHSIEEVWANSPSFDIAILRDLFINTLKQPFPISYKNERDYRTLKSIRKNLNMPKNIIENNNTHNALSDAIYQAKMINDTFLRF